MSPMNKRQVQHEPGRTARGSARRVVAVALMLFILSVAATAQPRGWQQRIERVTGAVRDITIDGEPYVVTADEYDPDNRIIHEQGAEIEYPVQLSEDEWRSRLTEDEYIVLREDGTEPAFENPLYDNTRAGIYYSAATGQPLFHSRDKFKSGTGWPSFTKPISPDAVAYMWDRGFLGISRRIEVIDSLSGSHIGHVFNDGPEPTGQRYCMNSAALIFVPEGGDPPPLLLESSAQ
jgi:methionine-R-sulfoxide reductase